MTLVLEGCILTPHGCVTGVLRVGEDGRIAAIEGRPLPAEEARGAGRSLLLPGFIDLHVHGGGGRDVMEGGDAAVHVARRHALTGTTAMLATTMTAPLDELESALRGLASSCGQRPPGAAQPAPPANRFLL